MADLTSLDSVLGLVSTGLGSIVALAFNKQWEQRREEAKVAEQLKRGAGEIGEDIGADPRGFNDYLFRTAGALSLREYAADAEVRRAVERAVSQIDALMEPASKPDDETVSSPQLGAAREALERGDPLGALAWLRLGIDLELNGAAERQGLSVGKPGSSALLRPLALSGLVGPDEVDVLSSAIYLANSALHGEEVDLSEAGGAIQAVAETLPSIQEGSPGD
jgi:hypothetical protein